MTPAVYGATPVDPWRYPTPAVMIASRFPLPVVRDLLGVTRALYRAERDGAGDPVRLQELVEIGEMLKLAMQMSKPGPRTLGHVAAWRWADEATTRLGTLVGADTLTGACVTATALAMVPKR